MYRRNSQCLSPFSLRLSHLRRSLARPGLCRLLHATPTYNAHILAYSNIRRRNIYVGRCSCNVPVEPLLCGVREQPAVRRGDHNKSVMRLVRGSS